MKDMEDMCGEILRIGDYVEYFVEGHLDYNSNELYIIEDIVWEGIGIMETPFAHLIRVRGKLSLRAPFFSNELRKPEPEDLI